MKRLELKCFYDDFTDAPKCSLRRPDHRNLVVDEFQPFINDSYIFSAYMDRRKNVIRTIGVLPFNFTSNQIKCSVWYDMEEQPEVTKGHIQVWDWYYNLFLK